MDHLAESETGTFFAAEAAEADIPDKLYFRTGEVAKLAAIKPYVLRFWETEFPSLGPKKSGTGRRLYRRKDVEMVFEIKRLLYEKRFTIPGARQALDSARQGKRSSENKPSSSARQQGELFACSTAMLTELRRELKEILVLLGGPAGPDFISGVHLCSSSNPVSVSDHSPACDKPSTTPDSK